MFKLKNAKSASLMVALLSFSSLAHASGDPVPLDLDQLHDHLVQYPFKPNPKVVIGDVEWKSEEDRKENGFDLTIGATTLKLWSINTTKKAHPDTSSCLKDSDSTDVLCLSDVIQDDGEFCVQPGVEMNLEREAQITFQVIRRVWKAGQDQTCLGALSRGAKVGIEQSTYAVSGLNNSMRSQPAVEKKGGKQYLRALLRSWPTK